MSDVRVREADDGAAVLAEWARLRAAVFGAAQAALSDPARAEKQGLSPEVIRTRDGHAPFTHEPALVPWLRAAARAMIPKGFRYEILSMMGGQVALVLLGLEDEHGQPIDL